jgi:hypothetical protein
MNIETPVDLSPATLSDEEVKKRAAVLRRFKELLLEQRRRFRDYIDVLDRQKNIIEKGKTEDIVSHIELEEKIASGITSVQKALEPMRFMYESVIGGTNNDAALNNAENNEIPEINAMLEKLKLEAAARIESNKVLLEKRMVLKRNELKNLMGNPFAKRKSIYAENQGAALIDISG